MEEREKENLPSNVHYSNGCNSLGWASLKPAVGSFFQVSHDGAGAQVSGSVTFPGPLQEFGSKVE